MGELDRVVDWWSRGLGGGGNGEDEKGNDQPFYRTQ